jgi:glyoxylase-like metal-dependent hydrolase (beta-lactamase superfamily II)
LGEPSETDEWRGWGISPLTKVAIVLALLIAIPYYWLLIDTGSSDAAPRRIDLGRLRTEASKLAGPLPTAIEAALPASDTYPGTLLVASGGLKTDRVGAVVYRLVTPGGDTVIDAGLSPDQAMAAGFATYDAAAQRTAESWLRNARRIVFTGQDIDHIGGLIASPSRVMLAARTMSNPDQAKRISQLVPLMANAQALKQHADDYAAIAPGVVMLHTPGHTPGSQMIYVRVASGREWLFAGDTVPMERNLTWLRPRSRYMAQWHGTEDRAAVIGWLKGLAALQQRAPGLIIVPSHDVSWLNEAEKKLGIAVVRSQAAAAQQE